MAEYRGRPIIFGEVLFDHFEDGSAVLGGAPFNVAWHLQGFGLEPLFVSRVGNDAQGQHVLEAMQAWGMDTQGVQLDPDRATGAVQVSLQGGQPSFDILPDTAYDHIDSEAVASLLEREACGLLYHGSLIARSPASRQALEVGKRGGELPVFLDVNLRAPWWEAAAVEQFMREARWIKLNDAELGLLLGQAGIARSQLQQAASTLRDRLGDKTLVITLGSEGACLADQELVCGEPAPVIDMKDTVGAGDAFSAVTIVGLLRNWPKERLLERALRFASRICGQRGATSEDRALYAHEERQWHDESKKE